MYHCWEWKRATLNEEKAYTWIIGIKDSITKKLNHIVIILRRLKWGFDVNNFRGWKSEFESKRNRRLQNKMNITFVRLLNFFKLKDPNFHYLWKPINLPKNISFLEFLIQFGHHVNNESSPSSLSASCERSFNRPNLFFVRIN